MEDGSGFKDVTKMSPSDFEYLLNIIGPEVTRQDTNYRKAISVTEKLAITVRFLTTGDSYQRLMYVFRISQIVPEVCEAITDRLSGFLKINRTSMVKYKEMAMSCYAICAVVMLLSLKAEAAALQREHNLHEVRDDFMSLDATMRNYGDKLERQEDRERQLGDTLRRALAGIEKRVALLQRSSEERAREMERFLMQINRTSMVKYKEMAMSCYAISAVVMLLSLKAEAAALQREHNLHEVRDDFMSLEATMRNYGDKLERHEGRERQLGDTLRRALAGIQKRVALLHRSSEERAREMERFLMQAEERERIQLQKTAQTIDSLGSMLESRLSRIEAIVELTAKKAGEAPPTEMPCMQSLSPKLELLEKRMGYLEEGLENGFKELSKSAQYINKFEEGLNLNLDKSANILEYLITSDMNNKKETDNALKEDSGTNEIRDLMDQMTESLTKLSAQTTEARNDAVQAMQETVAKVNTLESAMTSNSQKQSDLMLQKFNEVQNLTLVAVEQVMKELEATELKGGKEGRKERAEDMEMSLADDFHGVIKEINTLEKLTEASKKEIQTDLWKLGDQSRKESSDAREEILGKINEAMVMLSPEPLLKTLTDMEHVMLQAADGVMDVGRRVEYSAARVIAELGEEINTKSSAVESTISSRLDNLAASVLVNQTGAMETLSQKVESEISQVWRPIGIMYQQLTQSVGMLDKLQVQTENYVNGSLKSMGSVEGRVGEIGERVGEVEGNLNFLLGCLSLVATEFNLVKAGLAEALDDVRRNMASVNNNMREAAPGTEYDHINQVSPAEEK